VSGHDLAREIIARHGVDRYPGARLVLLKLMEEVGELTGAFIDEQAWAADRNAWQEHLRKEYADVGLTLYALGNALGFDLGAEMQQVVENETRRFT
jgi:NTP pyrophosphatase (non-canonical NTP hydrolase)